LSVLQLKEMAILASLSKRLDRKHTLSKNDQKVLSLIEDERRNGNITDVQAEVLQKYLASSFLADYIQTAFEPFIEKLLDEFAKNLEELMDDG
jgi:hypothetical protein